MSLVRLQCGLLQLSSIRYSACVLVAAVDRDGHRAPSRTVSCIMQFVTVRHTIMVSSNRLLLGHATETGSADASTACMGPSVQTV